MLLHELLQNIIPYLIAFLELIGISIIAIGSIRAVVALVGSRFHFGDEEIKLQLAQALALSLEFKLGAEILKTVTAGTITELIELGAVVALRVVLTFVIHWEIRTSGEEAAKRMQEIELALAEERLEQQEKNR